MSDIEYEVQVFEDGEYVASVSSADKDAAIKEASTYLSECQEITNVSIVVRRIETVQTIKIGEFDEQN